MIELKEGQEGYARYSCDGSKFIEAVTAWVKITKVNGEYLEFKHPDLDRVFKAKKNKFVFVKEIE